MTTRTSRHLRSLGFALLAFGALVPAHRAAGDGASTGGRFYVVVSRRLLTDVSENDAKAAVKAWSEALARERHLRAEPESVVADGPAALSLAWTSHQADVLAVTVDEYRDAGIAPQPAIFVTEMRGGDHLVEYLLLVHKDSGIADLDELLGRTLLLYDNSRTALALPWLDTELLNHGLAPTAEFFAQITPDKKLSAAILPVFFRQKDACLVSRRGFEVMRELNPQIGQQLKVLRQSPPMLPSFSVIRTDQDDLPDGIDLEKEIVGLHRSAAGIQILNIFQADSMTTVSTEEIEEAVAFLRHHDELLANWKSSPIGRKALAQRPASGSQGNSADASEEGQR